MATYAIGDLHGCFDSLVALLDRLPFDADRDRLWLVGDLVNRGPKNVEVLRWAMAMDARLGERFTAVLGNHDLHLLRRVEGLREAKPLDTMDDVLEAPDRDELLSWLRRRPLLHVDDEGDAQRVLVHAGLPPGWSVEEAAERAAEAAAAMADPEARRSLLAAHSDPAARRRAGRAGDAVEALPNLRTLDVDGRPCDHSGTLDTAPDGCIPWFRHPLRKSRGAEFVCGHWAALGYHREDGVTAIDSGCVWGQALTALRLEDGAVFQQPTLERDLPGRR